MAISIPGIGMVVSAGYRLMTGKPRLKCRDVGVAKATVSDCGDGWKFWMMWSPDIYNDNAGGTTLTEFKGRIYWQGGRLAGLQEPMRRVAGGQESYFRGVALNGRSTLPRPLGLTCETDCLPEWQRPRKGAPVDVEIELHHAGAWRPLRLKATVTPEHV
jgi:hypothetical protein